MIRFSVANLIRAALLAAPLAFFAPDAAAQQTQPHAEECTSPSWGYLRAANYEFGAVNLCSYPVAVWFLTSGGDMAQDETPPHGVFSTGFPLSDFSPGSGWIAATCRAGYAPDVDVSQATWDAILNSDYRCVRQ